MELKMKLEFDEEKLKELVEQAVEKLKAEGYIWRDEPENEASDVTAEK